MRIRMRGVGTLAVAATVAVSAAASASMYGVGNYGNFGNQGFYQIDAASGQATLIGFTGLSQIADIAWSRADGRMYALTTGADLYTINLSTGAATLVAARAGVNPEGALAERWGSGQLFATNSDTLGTVSKTNASFGAIGAAGGATFDLSGISFDLSGSLFGYAKNGTVDDTLVSIDRLTGAATTIGNLGINTDGVGGLTTDPITGILYLTDGTALYSVNKVTGAATLLGAHGQSGLSGIAVIPAPGTCALVAAAGLIRGRRRR